MLARTSVAALAVALAASAAAPAVSAKPPKLKMGIYDCYSYDSSRASLDYDSSIKLIAKGGYEYTAARKGPTMVKKAAGTYTVKRTTIRFARGTLNRVKGEVSPGSTPSNPAKFNLLAKNGEPAGITCTYVTDPKVNG